MPILLDIPLDGATLASGLEENYAQSGEAGAIRLINNAASLTFGGSDLADYLTKINTGAASITETGGVLRIVHNSSTLTDNITDTAPGVRIAMPAGRFEVVVEFAAEDSNENNEAMGLIWRTDPSGDPDTLQDIVFYSSGGGHIRASRSYLNGSASPNIFASWSPSKPFWFKIARDDEDAVSTWWKQNTGDDWTLQSGDEKSQYVGAGFIDVTAMTFAGGLTSHTVDVAQIDGLIQYSSSSPVATLATVAFAREITPSAAELVLLVDGVRTATTSTNLTVRYRYDGSTWSSFITWDQYLLESAYTPTTNIEFELKYVSDGVQSVEVTRLTAGSISGTSTAAVNTNAVGLVIDHIDAAGLLQYDITNATGKAWQIQVWNATDSVEATAITGSGNKTDSTYQLSSNKIYKFVLTVTTGGNRTDAIQPIWASHRGGVNR